MELAEFNAICNAIQAIGTAATPLVVAYIGARFIHRQTIHEAAVSEKAKHYITSARKLLTNRSYGVSYHLCSG